MVECTVIPVTANKACSGKCKSGGCHGTPRVWVVAACEGMIVLLEKDAQGALMPVSREMRGVFASLEQFQACIGQAEGVHAFDQLVIIGSGNDLAWVHASLPEPVTRHIAAEIEYPLLPAWFKQEPPLESLTHALKGVFA